MDDQAFLDGSVPNESNGASESESELGKPLDPIPSEVLESHRTYLKKVAGLLLRPELRTKISDSDLVQESMIVAVRKQESYRGKSPAEIRNWLEGILRRKYLDAMKKYYRSGKSAIDKEISIEAVREIAGEWDIPDAQGQQNADSHGNDAMAERLFAELDKLPEIDRILIERKAKDGQSISEIAGQLGITPESAHKRYQRALKKLYERLSARREDHC